jgi:protoheme ferro-lyase
LKLSQYDFENINFVSENYETLNEIIKNYSELDIIFSEYKDPHLLLNNEIFLEFTINTKT